MDDLINRAHNAYVFKRKDESIKLICAALRLMSQGVAQCLKEIEVLKVDMESCLNHIHEIKDEMKKGKE